MRQLDVCWSDWKSEMSRKLKTIVDRIFKEVASDDPDSKVKHVIEKWKNHDFTVQAHGSWQLEGVIMYLKFWHELAHAVDPTFPSRLPPRCFDPLAIAEFLGIPASEFAEYLPNADRFIVDGLDGVKGEVAQLAEALGRALPILEEQMELDLSKLTDTQTDRYWAATESKALLAKEICRKAGVNYNGNSRELISRMVKDGYLRKVAGGYVRVPTRQKS